jgi:hypothetical protein
VGKRSSFERRPADFYPTPKAAVTPLIPYLRASNIRSFAEPCAGEGDLVRHLEGFGLRCAYAGDISSGRDALERDYYGAIDCIITNPPYTRDLLHKLIEHFKRIAPTWLLLTADWVSTLQAVPYLSHCSDIVTVGRVKWFENSRYTSKDNFAWYRFDARHKGATAIHRRNEVKVISRRTGICEQCQRSYEPRRSTSRFCSQTCRQRAHRSRLSVTPSVTLPSRSSEVFRYVRHADVQKFIAEGWEPLPALEGTHHGEYSALMRRSMKPPREKA